MTQSILILDDDAESRRLLNVVLGARGYVVFEAGSAAQASRAMLEHRPDLVIVDGLLPDLPGVEWIADLRQRDTQTKVVFLSAFWRDLTTFHRLTQELGVALVAYKPVDPSAFAKQITELLPVEAITTPHTFPKPRAVESQTPGSDGTADIRHRMRALRLEYGESLPAKLEALEMYIAGAQKDPEQLAKAVALAHRLRGTAGAYGFELAGVMAGEVEDLLLEYQAADERPRRSLWPRVTRALGDIRVAARTPAASTPPSQGMAKTTSGTVLVVDEDPAFRRLATALLHKQMLGVCVAQSAAEAVDKARSLKLTAAIIDVHLANDSGLDVARRLRACPGHETLPLAFVSADKTLENRVAATHAGASLFLEKPVSEDSFSLALQSLLDQGAARQESRALLLEDDPDFTEQACLLLEAEGVEVLTIDDPGRLAKMLDDSRPDLLLLELDLPGTNGLDICRALRMSVRWQTLPILVVTARNDHQTRIEAFRAGATDFLSKPIIEDEFRARVGVRLEQSRLMRDRAERDALSGLMLRRPFLEAFEQRLSEAHRHTRPLSIALLDIDHFKQVNDRFGHSNGDAVIARLGTLLRQSFRGEDLRCRWGGEEFILALPGAEAKVAELAISRVLAEFAAERFSTGDTTDHFSVTISGGVAGFPEDGASVQALIRRADQRLYDAKRAGRNRVVGAPEETAMIAQEQVKA